MVEFGIVCEIRRDDLVGDEGHEVVLEVLAHAGEVNLTGDVVDAEVGGRTYAGAEEDCG